MSGMLAEFGRSEVDDASSAIWQHQAFVGKKEPNVKVFNAIFAVNVVKSRALAKSNKNLISSIGSAVTRIPAKKFFYICRGQF